MNLVTDGLIRRQCLCEISHLFTDGLTDGHPWLPTN